MSLHFKPMPDITTYELARVVALGFVVVSDSYAERIPADLRRHFVAMPTTVLPGADHFDNWVRENAANH